MAGGDVALSFALNASSSNEVMLGFSEDHQQRGENIDFIRFTARVTPLKAWFLKNRWPGQTGGVFVCFVSVYLQGWMKYTASQKTLPSDGKLPCCTELTVLTKARTSSPLADVLAARGSGGVPSAYAPVPSQPSRPCSVHACTAQPPGHRAGRLQREAPEVTTLGVGRRR